jgi:hypothetical protein
VQSLVSASPTADAAEPQPDTAEPEPAARQDRDELVAS